MVLFAFFREFHLLQYYIFISNGKYIYIYIKLFMTKKSEIFNLLNISSLNKVTKHNAFEPNNNKHQTANVLAYNLYLYLIVMQSLVACI